MFVATPVNYDMPPVASLVEVVTPRDVMYNLADLTISLSEQLSLKKDEIIDFVSNDSAFISKYGNLSTSDVSNMLGRPVIYVSPEYCVLCWTEKQSKKSVKLEFSGFLDTYDNLTVV